MNSSASLEKRDPALVVGFSNVSPPWCRRKLHVFLTAGSSRFNETKKTWILVLSMKNLLGLALISSACFAHAQLAPAQNFTFTSSVANTAGANVTTVYNNFGFGGSLGNEVPTANLVYTSGVSLPDGSSDTVLNLNFMDFLKIEHGIAPNGGGSYVNSYSVVMDVKVPQEEAWIPLFQTNTNNANDGDYWIRDTDSFWGVSSNYTGPALDRSRWNRIVAVVDLLGDGFNSTITTYANGTFIRSQTVSTFGQDGRWSLDPQILILADNDGESPTTAQLANLAIFGRGLSAQEATLLAGPGANPISVTQTVATTLTLQDTAGTVATPVPMSYTIYNGTNVVETGSLVAIGAIQNVPLEVSKLLNGAFTIELDGGPYLKKTVALNLSGIGTTLAPISLVNGDVDASGEVDAADIDEVIANFGATFPSTGDADVDVDGSGEVDAADIDIVIANFGAVDNG